MLDGRACPPVDEAERIAEEDSSLRNMKILRLAHKLTEGPIQAEVQAMRVGPVRWMSIPGEGFVETGLALKAAGASFVVGYANGWVGYLPVPAAYPQGGYEVEPAVCSRVAPGSAERVEAVGKMLLGKLSE